MVVNGGEIGMVFYVVISVACGISLFGSKNWQSYYEYIGYEYVWLCNGRRDCGDYL